MMTPQLQKDVADILSTTRFAKSDLANVLKTVDILLNLGQVDVARHVLKHFTAVLK